MAQDILAGYGSVGIGFVWGWLLGRRVINLTHRFTSLAAISLASLFAAAVIEFSAGWAAVYLWVVGAFVASTAHMFWRLRLDTKQQHYREPFRG